MQPKEPEHNQSPPDPFTGLLSAAVSMVELFQTYVEAGFTENQALKLIALMLKPESKDE